MQNKKIAILGGGLTGLTLANLLQENFQIEVFEKDVTPGGLCRSFNFENFIFDIGGHIIFSKDQEAFDFMIKTIGTKNLFSAKGNDAIVYNKKLINYPFETDLAKIGQQEAYECLFDFVYNSVKDPKNFHQWLHATFGKALAEKYLVPYNRKVWKIEPKDLDMNWVAKIPKPDPEELIKSCMGIPFEVKFERKRFFYPKFGGIQTLTENLAKKVKNLHLDAAVERIYRKKNGWIIKVNGKEDFFDDVISTVPVFNLVDILKEKIPSEVKKALRCFRYNSIMIACLGVDAKKITDITALYFPDEDFYPNRVCFMNNFGRNNAPKNKNSVLCEITYNPKSELAKMSDKEILKNVIEGFDKRKIIPKSKIIFQKLLRFPYAYVVFDKNYSKNVGIVYDWLKRKKIATVGRFAEFQYLNMDACIRHSIDFAKNYKL